MFTFSVEFYHFCVKRLKQFAKNFAVGYDTCHQTFSARKSFIRVAVKFDFCALCKYGRFKSTAPFYLKTFNFRCIQNGLLNYFFPTTTICRPMAVLFTLLGYYVKYFTSGPIISLNGKLVSYWQYNSKTRRSTIFRFLTLNSWSDFSCRRFSGISEKFMQSRHCHVSFSL